MSKLVPFTFETAKVRVIDLDGEPWFVAVDVANILEYSDAYEMTKKLDDDEKSNRRFAGLGSPSGGRGVTLINESGLYSCILTSQKPSAKRFKKWITSQVLPSIRKTGRYDTGEARRDASVAYKMMCETLQGSRKASGKDARAHPYINEARMINAALTGTFQGIERARLNRAEFDLPIRLEHENEFLLRQAKPYAERKAFLIDYANQYRQRAALKAAATKPVLERRPA